MAEQSSGGSGDVPKSAARPGASSRRAIAADRGPSIRATLALRTWETEAPWAAKAFLPFPTRLFWALTISAGRAAQMTPPGKPTELAG